MANTTWPRLLRRGQRPLLLELRSSTWIIILTVAFAVFTDIFPYAVIVPVMPFVLPHRAGVPKDKVQFWMSISLASFGAAVLISSPIWGYLADRTPDRKRPMLVGLFLLAGATLLLALMKNVTMMIIGRVFQGLTGALTWTVGLALIVDTVNVRHVGQVMGWISGTMSWATLSAPLAGGIVYAKSGWYPVWAMCFALVAGDIALRFFIIEKKVARSWIGNDVELTDTRSNCERLATAGTGASRDENNKQPTSLVHQQIPTNRPLENVQVQANSINQLLGNPRLLAALWGCVVESSIQTAFDSILPLVVESIFGWQSIGAGLIFLPFVIPTFLSPYLGSVGDRHGPKWPATFGFFLAAPFLGCMYFVTENSMGHKVLLCALLLGVGCGIACTSGCLMAEINWAIQADQSPEPGAKPIALAYGLYNVAFSGGALIGPLLGGFIRDRAGWQSVGWTLAVLSFLTGITQALWLGGPLDLKSRRRAATGSISDTNRV